MSLQLATERDAFLMKSTVASARSPSDHFPGQGVSPDVSSVNAGRKANTRPPGDDYSCMFLTSFPAVMKRGGARVQAASICVLTPLHHCWSEGWCRASPSDDCVDKL